MSRQREKCTARAIVLNWYWTLFLGYRGRLGPQLAWGCLQPKEQHKANRCIWEKSTASSGSDGEESEILGFLCAIKRLQILLALSIQKWFERKGTKRLFLLCCCYSNWSLPEACLRHPASETRLYWEPLVHVDSKKEFTEGWSEWLNDVTLRRVMTKSG